MRKFSSFAELTGYLESARGGVPVFLFGSDGPPQALTGSAFAETVRKRAEELRGNGFSCEAVVCDGSVGCVTEIFAANEAGKQVVLLDPSAEDRFDALLAYTDADCIFRAGALDTAPGAGVSGCEDRILFFTSGTTAANKAVVLTGASLMASAYNGSEMFPLGPEDNLLCLLPLSHVFGFVCGLLWGLSCGACVSLGRGMRHYIDDCAYFRPTAVSLVPLLLGFMLQYRTFNPELKTVLIGGGDCKRELLDAVTASGRRLAFGYGLTETSSGVAISTGGDPYAMDVCPEPRITLAGDGEILIEAPTCMMQGYYKDRAGTEEVLKGGILHTGDLGSFDADGRLHITGRKKEMIVLSSGTKIFLPEAEAELAKLLGTQELALALAADRVTLFLYAPDLDEEAVWEKIRPFNDARERASQVGAVRLVKEKLPRTATGKIKRYMISKEK